MQDEAGCRIARMAMNAKLVLENTHWNTGRTYFGNNGAATRPDYIAIPEDMRREGRVGRLARLNRSGERPTWRAFWEFLHTPCNAHCIGHKTIKCT